MESVTDILVQPTCEALNNTARAADFSYGDAFRQASDSIRWELESVETMLRTELACKDTRVAEILDYVAEFGGKRLRPCLLLLSAKASGQITEESIRLATVVELVHTATLLHDDVLDQATMRRHKPSVHTRWSVSTSILSGDWLFAQAYALANRGVSTLPGRWIATAAKQVCEGEMLQGMSVHNFAIGVEHYLRLVEGKTGALCAVSCALGAWSGGGDEKTCFRMQQFGLKLGTAFQIADDWLDVWGRTEQAGKTLGTDLATFKPTLPSIRTLERLPSHVRRQLIQRLDAGDQEAALELRRLADDGDASEYTLSVAQRLIDEATESLGGVSVSPAIAHLAKLAQLACRRDR
ncbi:MAG: polyprenyl synthetase family protein [Pirellula sp.]